jgi:hypothetical protein
MTHLIIFAAPLVLLAVVMAALLAEPRFGDVVRQEGKRKKRALHCCGLG